MHVTTDVASTRVHVCVECDLSFRWPGELANHLRRRHPVESFEPVPPPPATIVWLQQDLRALLVPEITDAGLAEMLRAA